MPVIRKEQLRKRQLYQCFNAKVGIEHIYCSEGHELPPAARALRCLERGDPLEPTVCQKCNDYDKMGPPLYKADRGWINMDKEVELCQKK